MPTLYLHIGTPKTGTTAIQLFCEENHEALERKGYCFPILGFRKSRGLEGNHRNGDFLIKLYQRADGSFEIPEEEAIYQRYMGEVVAKFQEFPNVILSEETIWNLSKARCPGIWKNLKRAADEHGFDVRVLVYLRRQDLFLESTWAQRIKLRICSHSKMKWSDMLAEAFEAEAPTNLEEARELIVLDYFEHLEEIASYFGRENIIVRIYERNRFPQGNAILDFLDILGLPFDEAFRMSRTERNPSLYGNGLEIKRIINNLSDADVGEEMQRMTRAAALKCCPPSGKNSYSPYAPGETEALLARFEESNRKLAQIYLGDASGKPFAPPKPVPPAEDAPEMYESVVRFFGAMFAMQNEKIDRLAQEATLGRQLRKLGGRAKRAILRRLPHRK